MGAEGFSVRRHDRGWHHEGGVLARCSIAPHTGQGMVGDIVATPGVVRRVGVGGFGASQTRILARLGWSASRAVPGFPENLCAVAAAGLAGFLARGGMFAENVVDGAFEIYT